MKRNRPEEHIPLTLNQETKEQSCYLINCNFKEPKQILMISDSYFLDWLIIRSAFYIVSQNNYFQQCNMKVSLILFLLPFPLYCIRKQMLVRIHTIDQKQNKTEGVSFKVYFETYWFKCTQTNNPERNSPH